MMGKSTGQVNSFFPFPDDLVCEGFLAHGALLRRTGRYAFHDDACLHARECVKLESMQDDAEKLSA